MVRNFSPLPKCCIAVKLSMIHAPQAGTISPSAKCWLTPVPCLALSLHWVLFLFWSEIPVQPWTEGNKARCSLCSPRTKYSPRQAQRNQSCCSEKTGKEPSVKCGDGEGSAMICKGGKTHKAQATKGNIMKYYEGRKTGGLSTAWPEQWFYKGVNKPEKWSP